LLREVSVQPSAKSKDIYPFKLPKEALSELYNSAQEQVNKNDSEEEQG
jgi:hypothetical protein